MDYFDIGEQGRMPVTCQQQERLRSAERRFGLFLVVPNIGFRLLYVWFLRLTMAEGTASCRRYFDLLRHFRGD